MTTTRTVRRRTSPHRNFGDIVAQYCEFSGYGPAVADGPTGIKIHYNDELFAIKFNDAGVPHCFPAALRYQNSVQPEVQAVFSVLHGLTKRFGHAPPLQDKFRAEWLTEDHVLHLDSHYAWLVDPARNQQLVLHELLYDNQPLWHRAGLVDYQAPENTDYYPQVESMFLEFMRSGLKPKGWDTELADSVALYLKMRGDVDEEDEE